jgi:hypothetical protein
MKWLIILRLGILTRSSQKTKLAAGTPVCSVWVWDAANSNKENAFCVRPSGATQPD